MSGHLFVVRGDVTLLHCDAFAVPTDRFGNLIDSFLAQAPEAWRERSTRIEGDALDRLCEEGAIAASGWGGCHFLDIGRVDEAPIEVYEKALRGFFDLALEHPADSARERPLLAVPLMGARHGGAAKERAQHVAALLGLLWRLMDDDERKFDVVVAAWSAELFAWTQEVRRATAEERFSELGALTTERVAELGKLAAAGRLVLFVGAGVSVGVGLPTWEGLLSALEDKWLTRSQAASARAMDVLDRAAVVASVLDGRSVGEAVAQHLGDARVPGLQHALLVSLPVTEMATTNYDQLLEIAAGAAHDPVTVIPYRNAQSARRWLLKLHGDIDQSKEIVLTREDYLSYPEQRGALRGIVQALLLTRHMLFVGFSMTDDNFARIAHDVRRVTAMAELGENASLGTVLSLFENEARELMWGKDLQTIAVDAPLDRDADAEMTATRVAVAARRHEILLDRLVLEAAPASLHILDPTFDGALSDVDRHAKHALASLAEDARRFAADASPAWAEIHALLERLGGR